MPQGGVAGEALSPTQPFPTHPAPLHPYEVSAADAFGFTPFDRASCREQIEKLRWDGAFTPPTLQGSVQFPHTAGGINWGGVAIDPRTRAPAGEPDSRRDAGEAGSARRVRCDARAGVVYRWRRIR